MTVHEFLGHGIIAWCLGGHFSGVQLNWVGGGEAWAFPAPGAPTWHSVAIYFGGATATIIIGALFIGLSLWQRHRIFSSMILALLSVCFVLSGSIYMFWSSYLPIPPGDFARIIQVTGSGLLRWMFMIIGLMLTVLFSIVPLAIVVRCSDLWLGQTAPLTGARKTVMPISLGIGYTLGTVLYDWQQLIQGIGQLPRIVGVVSGLALTAALFCVPHSELRDEIPRGAICRPLLVTWFCLLVMVLVMWLWLVDGISW